MAVKIRVLDATNRTMQRLGYLKLLCARAANLETSSLSALGHYLVETVTRRIRIDPPIPADLREYVRIRLTDRTYRTLRTEVLSDGGPRAPIVMEIQDVYLADQSLPSRTGKLVGENWRRYPYLATALDLIKKGTYSALTRSLVLLQLTPRAEMDAFDRIDRSANPFRLSLEQAFFFLYGLIDNDAEVIYPFFTKLAAATASTIAEKDAGQFLPEIIRLAEKKHSKRALPHEDRERLAILRRVADTIESWKKRPDTGGGALRENVSVRLEPYCDIGLLIKPDRDRYEYRIAPRLRAFLQAWNSVEDTDAFLDQRFFKTIAACWNIPAEPASDEAATAALIEATESLKSPLGYAPITDMGLLAGLRLLCQQGRVLELRGTMDLLKKLQKEQPDFVRFTVDRMGRTAYAKFLKRTAATSA